MGGNLAFNLTSHAKKISEWDFQNSFALKFTNMWDYLIFFILFVAVTPYIVPWKDGTNVQASGEWI